MKKRILITLSIVIVVALALVMLSTVFAKDLARMKLSRTIAKGIASESNDSDYISEDGARLVIRNGKTREFLLKALKTATAEEVTGTVCKPWPSPFYYTVNERIGGNLTLCVTYAGREFFFHLDGENRTYLHTYILAIEQAGELFGTDGDKY